MPIKMLVRENMERAGIASVSQLADRAGISYNTALALARGSSTRIDFATLEALCRVFQVEPGALIVLEPVDSRI